MKQTALFFGLAYVAIQSIPYSTACPQTKNYKEITAFIKAVKNASPPNDNEQKTWTFKSGNFEWEISEEGYKMIAENEWDAQLPNSKIVTISYVDSKNKYNNGKKVRVCNYTARWEKIGTNKIGQLKFNIQRNLGEE